MIQRPKIGVKLAFVAIIQTWVNDSDDACTHSQQQPSLQLKQIFLSAIGVSIVLYCILQRAFPPPTTFLVRSTSKWLDTYATTDGTQCHVNLSEELLTDYYSLRSKRGK